MDKQDELQQRKALDEAFADEGFTKHFLIETEH